MNPKLSEAQAKVLRAIRDDEARIREVVYYKLVYPGQYTWQRVSRDDIEALWNLDAATGNGTITPVGLAALAEYEKGGDA